MKTVWGLLGTLVLTTAAHAVPIVIQVNGPDGKPVPNAEVRATRLADDDKVFVNYGLDEALRDATRTDNQGVARFDWPALKKYRDAPPTRRQYMGSATVWANGLGAANLTLIVGDNAIKLGAAGAARGVVRDLKGAPVGGAKVSAVGAWGVQDSDFAGAGKFAVAPDEAAFTAVSDAQGRWRIGNLPLGGRATVQIIDSALAATNATAPVLPNDAPFIEVPPSDKDEAADKNGNLRAMPAATLSGRVVNPQGEPVAGVTVMASAGSSSFNYNQPNMTRTDDKGEYRLQRLEAGTYSVVLKSPDVGPLVADPESRTEIKLESGQSQTAPDQKLVPSGTVVVQVNDARDGKPIPNTEVVVSPTKMRAGMSFSNTGRTDQNGKLELRVAPGQYRVILWGASGYITPTRNPLTGNNGEAVTVVADANQSVTWKLERGLTAQGRVVDEKGKVLPGVGLYFRDAAERGGLGSGISVLSSEAGAWQSTSFEEGEYKVSLSSNGFNQSPQWELVAPKTFAVPGRDNIDIVVKPIAQTSLSGRVVDTQGNGIAGVRISAKITSVVDNSQSTLQREAFSDATGNYTVTEFPANARTVLLSAERAGYTATRVPETQNTNQKWSASDTVLQALSAQISGRVVDANNQPQSAVQVLAPRFGTVAVSDADGAWQFDKLAPGDNEIVAIGAAGGAVQSVAAGENQVQLKLRPFVAAPPRDIKGAREVLEEAWQTSRGANFYERESLPAALAPYDPDAALEIVRGADAKAPDNAVAQIVQVLAAKDAEQARKWAPKIIETIDIAESKINAALSLAQALVETHPDEAKVWLQKSIAWFGDVKDGWQNRNAASKIAALSAQLEQPDAQEWFERAFELAASQKAEGVTDYSSLTWQVAAVNADWAERSVEAAIKSAPDQPQYANGPEIAVSAAIRRLAHWNVDAAQQMLDKYGAIKARSNSTYQMDSARGVLIIERLKQNADVDAALKDARALNSMQQRALTHIAAIAPPARRVEILREMLQLARADDFNRSPAIGVAAQLLPYDRELAKQTLDESAESFQTYNANRDRYSRSGDVAAWALAYRDIDAAQARWQLEREWARQLSEQIAPDDQWIRGSQLQHLILAMAAIDVARAREMIFALPVNEEGGAPFIAARTLAHWMLADQKERQARSFSEWSERDIDDDFYTNNW